MEFTLVFHAGFFVGRVPVDTERKFNVHKTFRKRPGRLLNVLCAFNLRPVSAGAFMSGEIRCPTGPLLITLCIDASLRNLNVQRNLLTSAFLYHFLVFLGKLYILR